MAVIQNIHNSLVVGCGPVGMLTAIALSELGLETIIIGHKPKQDDQRTTAVMLAAVKFLKKLHLWEDLKENAASLSTMRLVDGTNRLLRSPTVTFKSTEIGKAAFGYNIENKFLNEVLLKKIAKIKHIEANVTKVTYGDNITCHLDNNEEIKTNLLFAADGKNSTLRKSLNIRANIKNYDQVSLVLKFLHEFEHQNISTEIHTPFGPFTQVPLPGKNSSLIWTVNKSEAERIKNLPIEKLNILIEQKLNHSLGKINIQGSVQSWQLSSSIAKTFAKNGVILLGETAHSFPPIGAQGLNLSIRDIEDICKILSSNTKDICQTYNELRIPDVKTRALAVNSLNQSLISNSFGWQILRSAGFTSLKNFAPLRKFFIKEGMSPSEFILKFTRLFL